MARIAGAALPPLAVAPFAAAALGGFASSAHAQTVDTSTSTTALVETAIPDNFDRGRNISVNDRPRPDYDPLGVRFGSFVATPQIEVGTGATNNVFLASNDRRTAGFGYVQPTVQLLSDWDRDQLRFSGTGLLQRYFTNSRRDEDTFDVRGLYRKDLGSTIALTAEAQDARLFESPETGAIDPTLAVLSSYNRSYFSGRGQYTSGQFRGILAVDRTAFSFDEIDEGSFKINQDDRNRVITRGTAEAQYAFTPSVSVYVQGTYDHTDYNHRLPGDIANQDSVGYRVITGLNFDLAGFMRGKVGIGYVDRSYRSDLYKDAHGLSAEAEIEFFPSELTTYTVQIGRTLQDSNVTSTSAYFDDDFQVGVDHELLANLIVGATVGYRHQTYVDVHGTNDYYQTNGNVKYLVSNEIAIKANFSYLKRTTSGEFNGAFDEARGQIGVVFQR